MKHTSTMIRGTVMTALLLGGVWLSGGMALAQTEQAGINVKPAILEDKTDPGAVYNSELEVTNIGSKPQTLYVVKKDISGIDDQGVPTFAKVGETTDYELSSWISVDATEIVIPANGSKKIPFSIKVPKDATPGGHFGGIFLSSSPVRPTETGVGVGFQVGTLINLRISGDIVEDMLVREFKTDRSVYSKPQVVLSTVIENKGNVLLRPRGPVDIVNMFGKKVGVVKMNDSASAVLPNGRRDFSAEWAGDGLAFGRYQAIMSLSYGQDSKSTVTRTVSFWIFPLNIILPVGVVLLLIIGGGMLSIRMHVRKKVRELTGSAAKSHKADPTTRLVTLIIFLIVLSAIFLAGLLLFLA